MGVFVVFACFQNGLMSLMSAAFFLCFMCVPRFLLCGQAHEAAPPSDNPAPEWLEARSWAEVQSLALLPSLPTFGGDFVAQLPAFKVRSLQGRGEGEWPPLRIPWLWLPTVVAWACLLARGTMVVPRAVYWVLLLRAGLPRILCVSLHQPPVFFSASPLHSQALFDSDSAEEVPLPSALRSKYSELQRLCILRCLRPDKVTLAIQVCGYDIRGGG